MEILKSKKTMWEKFYRTMESQEGKKGRVITLTLNPNVTQTIVVDELVTGQENELYTMTADIGGLGIDVSRILNGCGYSTMCSGFEFSTDKKTLEQFMQMLKIPYIFAEAEGKMRSIVRVLNKSGRTSTDIKERGWKVSGAALQNLYSKRKKVMDGLKQGDILDICGSVPAGVPDDVYRKWIAGAKDKKACTVLCAEGALFVEAMKEVPYAVVISDTALEKYSGRKLEAVQDIKREAEILLKQGVSIVCIYNDDHEIFLADSTGITNGKAYAKDSICECGAVPSIIAGLNMAMIREKEELALDYILAALNGTLHKAGNGMCTSADFEKYFQISN